MPTISVLVQALQPHCYKSGSCIIIGMKYSEVSLTISKPEVDSTLKWGINNQDPVTTGEPKYLTQRTLPEHPAQRTKKLYH